MESAGKSEAIKSGNIRQAQGRYSTFPGVFVHWILFGSSGHMTPPGGGTVDSYTKAMSIETATWDDFDHAPDGQRDRASSRSRSGKSIIDPRAVSFRAPTYRTGTGTPGRRAGQTAYKYIQLPG